MPHAAYATDLTDTEWQLVEPSMRSSGFGRPPLPSKQELPNAISYQLRVGSGWHLLPYSLLLWRTVYKRLKPGREGGTWHRLLTYLR
jgi:transposase